MARFKHVPKNGQMSIIDIYMEYCPVKVKIIRMIRRIEGEWT